MSAIVCIAGKQFNVKASDIVCVPKLKAELHSSVTFDEVLLVDNGKEVVVGRPKVKGAEVRARVLGHVRDDKVIVFKKKRRKGYRVKAGHRQGYTKICIEDIIGS